jgi:hypothetical protein
MSVTRFAHVVNPVRVAPSSDLFIAQPVTFESMRAARESAHGKINVTLFAAHYPEDEDYVPELFQRLRPLGRSVLDVHGFAIKKKLPLISDILARLAEAAPEADYFIYTNVDIALMPHFYTGVATLLGEGYDALTITRRTIPKTYTSPAELPRMYAELGESHPGYDCFIFRREAHARYDLGNACIGAHWFGKALELNLICQARRYAALKDLHMTFHIGDDRPWKDDRFKVFARFNQVEIRHILLRLHAEGRLINHPEIQKLVETFTPELQPNATRSF